MKTDAQDMTFIILVRLDSVRRLENILTVTEYLSRCFYTNIIVWEADAYNNNVLRKLLSGKVTYRFFEDKDPVLHKTMYYNCMILQTKTPFVAIWDADALAEKKFIVEAMEFLRLGKADLAYPYSGRFLEVAPILRNLFLLKRNIRILNRHIGKMNFLYEKTLFGGAVMMNREKFIQAGLDNEDFYGWADEDFERYQRCYTLGLKIFRTKNCLFHLWHPRNANSRYHSSLFSKVSSSTLLRTINSSFKEIGE
jgi:predicted glycosyltransferase involved in capsule biosynthesis